MESVRKKRRKARVDETLCVACGCCVKVCPAGGDCRGEWFVCPRGYGALCRLR